MRVALGIEYDGSRYHGWESQRHVRTVQERVDEAVSSVADHPLRTVCAGRTDTGVHAWGQVVHFDTRAERPLHAWVLGVNANLPDDVCVTWARAVREDFHARFSAVRRHYRYLINNSRVPGALLRQRAAWEPRPLDAARMLEGAAHLRGSLDFSSFRAASCQSRSPVRDVQRLDVARHGDLVCIDVVANAFLHHMVRNIAGVLMAIGTGRHEPEWSREVLEARDRTAGGVTAPPQGLYLVGVDYPDAFGIPRVSPPPAVW